MTAFRGARAVLLGALLVAAMTALVLFSNLRYGRYIAASSLPSAATFFFVLTLVGNAVVRRVRTRWALTVPELALIFAMLYVSAALPQASVAETLVTLGAAPAYYPKGAPRLEGFEGEIAPWLAVHDAEAVRRFYEGYGPSFRGLGQVPWRLWLPPLAGWSVFVVLLLTALYALSRIFAHRWVREERVSFPLMEMPLELMGATAAEGPPVWRTALFWAGAAIPASMIAMGQFHRYYPWLPDWQQIASYPVGKGWEAQGPPMSALSEFTLSVWPLVVGVSYFLNGEVAVSIWGFHLLFWAQMYLYAALGYTPEQSAAGGGGAGFRPLDWIHNLEFGAAAVLTVTLIAPLRREIGRATRALFGETPAPSAGPLTVPPWSVAAFLLANGGMLAWAWAAGMHPGAAAAFLLFLYVLVIALGRMVAAGGLYLVDNGCEPQPLLYGLAGPGAFSKGTHYALTGQEALFGRADMSFFYFTANEAKVAEETGTARARWHGVAIVLAVGVALLLSYFLLLWWSYRFGGVTFRAYPYSSKVRGLFDRLDTFTSALRRGPDGWTYGGLLVGGLAAALLAWLNRTFLWWRVAPFGFAMASSWNVNYQVWSSVFVGWSVASLVRRYGGLKLYRALRPFFVGLIVGDAVTVTAMAVLEIIVGA